MIRNFFIGMSFLGILFLAFYTLYDKKKESIFSLNTCQPLTCDLNLQDCVFSFNKKNIEVSAYPKPIKIFNKTTIKIKNFPHYSNLKIKIYSLNSYIGDIIPKFNIVNGDIQESVQTVSVVEGGNLTARITANPRNPQLIELKNVLNKLLDVLQARVGSDMNAIHKIFEEYKSLDFRNKLENASGSVELTTNALGDEIVKMLKQSSDFANALANESGKLQTAVQSLTTSSNSQAPTQLPFLKSYDAPINISSEGVLALYTLKE